MSFRTRAGLVAAVLRGLATLSVAILAHACSEPPQAPLQLALNPWVGYDPFVIAREHGLFDPSQLRVIELETTSDSILQLRNGLIDAAGLTLPEAVELAAAGTDIRIVSVLSLSKGADAVLVANGIADAAGLKGGRVGLEDTALASIMLQRLLEAGGLKRDDLHLVTLPVSDHEWAMRRGTVDAVITFEPVISRLRAAGFDIVLDSANMPGEVVDVLVVRADVLEQRPAHVRALINAFERGRQEMLERPEQAARELAPGIDLSEADYLAALSRIRLFSARNSDQLLREARRANRGASVLALNQLSADLRASGRMMVEPRWSTLFAVDFATGDAR